MSGHNKWSKIKHKKAATDAAKSKVFGKYAHLIAIESKKVAGNTESPSLKAVIDRARKENMPNDNIERAIKKGMSGEGALLEEVTYETYGPAGVGIIIEGLTDNKNRTAAEIRHILSKQGFELATPGSTSWAFNRNNDGTWSPNSSIEITEADGEKLNTLINALEENEDVQEVYTNAV